MEDKSYLVDWRERVGQQEATRQTNKANIRGTAVHGYIESHLLKRDYTVNLFDRDIFKQFLPIINEVTEIYTIEGQLYSDMLEIAGSVDFIGKWKGKKFVLDWKTSKKAKRKEDIHGYFMQASFYAVAFYERTGIPVRDIKIVIGVDDDTQPCVYDERVDNWFDSLKTVRNNYKLLRGI